jgi:hypothetical protein
MNGYTNTGLILWDVVTRILEIRIDPNFSGVVDYGIYTYYIVNYINFGVGHFTNLIEKENYRYFIFDVWDGKNKLKEHKDIRRVIKIYQ